MPQPRISHCDQPLCWGVKRCRRCRNAYARRTRKKHRDLPELARKRANCRAYTHMLIKRGQLVKGPCEDRDLSECRGPVQAHHDDYDKPREVRWKCVGHHKTHHKLEGVV